MPNSLDALVNPSLLDAQDSAPPASSLDALVNPHKLAPELLKGNLRDNNDWDRAAADLKEAGLDPEPYRQNYLLSRERARTDNPATKTSIGEAFVRRTVPFGGVKDALLDDREYADALKKFRENKASQEDVERIVKRERFEGAERELTSSFPGLLLSGVGRAPQIYGEAAAAGKVLGVGGRALGLVPEAGAAAPSAGRQALNFVGQRALMTPLQPSLYLEQASRANIEAGRDPADPRGFPTPLALGVANNLVLGSLGPIARGLPGGAAVRIGGAGALGLEEQAGVDVLGGIADEFLPKAYKTQTRYGVLGQLARREGDDAAKHAAVQFLTFSLFAALHDKPTEPLKKAFTQTLDTGAKKGQSAPEAAKPIQRVNDLFDEIMNQGGTLTPEQAKELVKQAPDAAKPYAEELGKVLVQEKPKDARHNPDLDALFEETTGLKPNAPGERSAPIQPLPQNAPESPTRPVEPSEAPGATGPQEGGQNAQAGSVERLNGTPPSGELLYRVPDYKSSGSNVEAAKAELGFTGKGFAGKWFSKGKEQNEGYWNSGKVQFEMDPTQMGKGKDDAIDAESRPKDANVGSNTPMYLHPALTALRYRGEPDSAAAKDLKSLVDDINAERAKEGLAPVAFEAVSPRAPRTAGMLFKAAETEPKAPEKAPEKPKEPDREAEKETARQDLARVLSEANLGPKEEAFVRAYLRGVNPGYSRQRLSQLKKSVEGKIGVDLAQVREELRGQRASGMRGTPEGEAPPPRKPSDAQSGLDSAYRACGKFTDLWAKLGSTADFNEQLKDALSAKLEKWIAADRRGASAAELKAILAEGPLGVGKPKGAVKQLGKVGETVKIDPDAHQLLRTGGTKSLGTVVEAGWSDAKGQVLRKPLVEPHAMQDEKALHASAERVAREDAGRVEEQKKLAGEAGPEEGGSTEFPFGDAQFGGFGVPLKVFNTISRFLFGRPRGADPAFKPDADPNPDNPRAMPSWDVASQAAANQLGARNHTDAERATTAHAFLRHVADQTGNAWLLAHAKGADPFKMDAKGQVELADGTRAYKTDVIEKELRDPGSQSLTDAQRDAVAMWKGIWEKQLRALEAAGAKKFYDEDGNERTVERLLKEGYFPNPIKPGSELREVWDKVVNKAASSTYRPGTSPFYRRGSEYKTEQAGAEAGVKYLGFYESVADFIKATNREIADTHLANDPLLQGKDLVTPRFQELLAKNKAVLDALPAAEREQLVRQLRGLATQAATGNVFVAPAFRGKEYPKDVKSHLEMMYGERAGPYLKLAGAVQAEMRGLVLGPDASFATLQLQSMMFSNPVRWAKTVARGLSTFLGADPLARLVQTRPEYRKAVEEITQSGGSIGTLPEQVAGLSPGKSLVGQVPVLGKAFEKFGRAFSTTMDLAKVELWLANRPADPQQWPRAIEAIENSLGQGRMEQLGMSPERAFLERLLLLAPSYYRAHVKLLEQATQRGSAGLIARKQLGFLASGVLLSSIGALYAAKDQGWLSDAELEERLDPSRGKFLTVPIPLGGSGKTVNVGLGGFYVSIARTLGNAVAWQEGRQSDNPFFHWYRGHAGVLPRLAADMGTGKDYFGNPITPGQAALRSVLPVAVQQGAMDEGTPSQRAADVGAGLVGLRSFPGSDNEARMEGLRRLSQGSFGKDYADLSIKEKARVVKQLERSEAGQKPQASPGQMLRAQEAEIARQERLTRAVSPATRTTLETIGHKLPSYEAALSVNGVSVPLTRGEQDRYEKLLVEEYDRAVEKWPVERLRAMRPDQREKWVRDNLERAKEKARNRLIRG